MTLIIIEFVIVLIGLVVTPVLFYHFPRLPETRSKDVHFPHNLRHHTGSKRGKESFITS